MADNCKPPAKPGRSKKFRPWFRSRSGKIFYAADYGHKAWPIG